MGNLGKGFPGELGPRFQDTDSGFTTLNQIRTVRTSDLETEETIVAVLMAVGLVVLAVLTVMLFF
jgi:hypothetical protein